MPATKRLKPSQVSALGHPEAHLSSKPWEKDERSKSELNRITAEQRRKQETNNAKDLARTLPFPEDVTDKLHRASVYRLAISYLQMRDKMKEAEKVYQSKPLNRVEVFNHDQQIIPYQGKQKSDLDENNLMLDILNGFVIYVSTRGVVLYVSENVSQHLGLDQIDIIGHETSEFIHSDDQGEIMKQLLLNNKDDSNMVFAASGTHDGTMSPCTRRFFYVRMKCFYLKKGVKSKQPGYMLVQWSGHLKIDDLGQPEGLVCICRPLQPTPILEIRMDGNMFMSRHSMDLKFTFCDQRIATLLGYEPDEIVGQNAYLFHNPVDAHLCMACHNDLMTKGSSMSKYYRFLSKSGKWVWMQTRASVICNTHNEPQYVVCMNYIVSEKEGQKSIEEAEKNYSGKKAKNSRPSGVSEYPHDTCSAPAFVEQYHSTSKSSSDEDTSCSPSSSDQWISSPGSVLSTSDKTEGNTTKRLRSSGYSSASINSMDCTIPDSTTDVFGDECLSETRLTVHSLTGHDLYPEQQHSTGNLHHEATDIMWPMLTELINQQAAEIMDTYGPEHSMTQPNDEMTSDFTPETSTCSNTSSAHMTTLGSGSSSKGGQYTKLRSLYPQSGLNQLRDVHKTPGKVTLTRIEHISPNSHKNDVVSHIANGVVDKSDLNYSEVNASSDLIDPALADLLSGNEQLDELLDMFDGGVTISEAPGSTELQGADLGIMVSDASVCTVQQRSGLDVTSNCIPTSSDSSTNTVQQRSGVSNLTEHVTTQGHKQRKGMSQLERLLKADTGHSAQCSPNTDHSADCVTRSSSSSSTSATTRGQQESLLQGLLAGQVKPAEAHCVAVNENAPSFQFKDTSSDVPATVHMMDDCSLSSRDHKISSLGLSLDDVNMCVDIPEYSDWRELLGPLSPRSQALVEEAVFMMDEVDRQESQTRAYWSEPAT